MKKTFLLTHKKKDPQRVLEAIKSDIKKYIKREKRKELPDGFNFWKINCKFGKDEQNAAEIKFEDISKNINQASQLNYESFYIELIAQESIMNFKKKEDEKIDESEIIDNIEDKD